MTPRRTNQAKKGQCMQRYLLNEPFQNLWKITFLLKYHQKYNLLHCVFLVFDHSPWSLSWYSRPDCSPEDLYTIELLKTANLHYKFNLNPNKSVHQIFVSVPVFGYYKFLDVNSFALPQNILWKLPVLVSFTWMLPYTEATWLLLY